MEALDRSSDRRKFLKQLGAALGVAVGAIALPSIAKATTDTTQCCRTNCTSCGAGTTPYFCNCIGDSYCACFSTSNPTCFSAPC